MAWQSDDQGFLIGERRLIGLTKGMDNVHTDTAEILSLLKAQLGVMVSQQVQQKWQTNKLNDAVVSAIRTKQAINVSVNLPAQAKKTRQTGVAVAKVQGKRPGINQPVKSTTKSTSKSAVSGAASNPSIGAKPKNTDGTAAVAGRDAQGRFIGTAKTINEKAFTSILSGIKSGGAGMHVNAGGIDPTVDAVHELGTLLSPAKGAFRLMGRGAMWLYKKGKPKRSEELPKEQQDHNTEVERNNTETRKLFRKLIDAVNRQRNSSGSGLFGSLPIPGRGGRNGRNGRNAPVPANGKGKGKGGPAPVPVPGKAKPAGGGKAGKIGKLLGGVGRKLPLVGALVGGGMLASQWGEMDAAEKGGGIGSMIGGGIGGVAGALLGPVGAVAGATIGSVIGDAVGQKVGRWTESLKGQDVGGTIVKGWNDTLDGINKMVKDGWTGLGKYGPNMAGYGAAGGGFMLASYNRNRMGNTGSSGGYGAGLHNSTGSASSENLSKEADRNQSAVYNALIKKFSKSQAMALTAEVGREGGYASSHLYGTHTDQANNLTNIGMISWQGERGKQLRSYLTQKGVFKDGKIIPGQAALDAQAEFIKMEIDTNPAYAKTKEMFAANPNADPEQYSKTLGQNYIGWAYGQDKLKSGASFAWRSHDARRRGHLNTVKKKVDNLGQPNSQPNANQSGKPVKTVTVSAQPARKENKPMFVSDYPKAVKNVEIEKASPLRRVNSKSEQPVMMASANLNNISQLPADRDIAHAITGGLGMRTLYT